MHPHNTTWDRHRKDCALQPFTEYILDKARELLWLFGDLHEFVIIFRFVITRQTRPFKQFIPAFAPPYSAMYGSLFPMKLGAQD